MIRVDTLLVFAFCLVVLTALCSGDVPASQSNNQWFKDGVSTVKKHLLQRPNTKPAKNLIIFVGDGCDINTNTAGRILKGQLKGQVGEKGWLSYEEFPYTGLSKTYTTNRQGSDSAGTANAMFTGVKTRSAMIGVNEEVVTNKCETLTEDRKVDSILKLAEEAGMATGFITSMRLTHATPANLYAHSASRYWESDKEMVSRGYGNTSCKDMAQQLVDFQGSVGDGIEVVMGGGRRSFLPNTTRDPEHVNKTGERYDGRNLIQEWLNKREGSVYAWNKTQFDAVDPKTTKHFLGMFESSHMQFAIDRDEDVGGEPSIAEMVEKAVSILKNNDNGKGFFLAVEAGLIDIGHHNGIARQALNEVVNLEEGVAKAVEMTDKEDTLIISTADHGHVFTLTGYPDINSPIFGLMKQDGEVKLALNDNKPYTILGYMNGPGAVKGVRANLTGVDTGAKDFKQQALYIGYDYDEAHGSQDVGIYSRGPWAHLLTGVVEQNVIFHVMDHALCLSSSKQGTCSKPEARGGPSASAAMVTALFAPLVAALVTCLVLY
ncbi:predicted protein [Nematostella vectensis]|uniref:alkaline phosphatase n=1 Tax=Nematostella vectensis TaxID=45351 RepID=A7RSL3_NEMVE|nr:alkaline phosphatase isoform X2 [Nematostella vectensis]EDO45655.1 predicted protein [Nematostella vectensis]|eukprot:XP_001637718.1 predicted protein [Nematostella vectensis]